MRIMIIIDMKRYHILKEQQIDINKNIDMMNRNVNHDKEIDISTKKIQITNEEDRYIIIL